MVCYCVKANLAGRFRSPTSNGRILCGFPVERFLHLAAGTAALTAMSRSAEAQAYPTRRIRLVVPFAAGGSTDAVARILAERMSPLLRQPVIVENVTGADGSIGLGRVAGARPDGYTIDFGTIGTHVLNGALYSLPYDVLNDFDPISALTAVPFLFCARRAMPENNMPELISRLKANPKTVSVGIAGPSPRLLSVIFQKETGTQLTIVPYRGLAPARQDLVAGQIDLLIDNPDDLALLRARSIKVYAVTSETRLASAPDIPTFSELGLPALSWSAWTGLFAPKGTPSDVIGRLNAAAVEALADPAVRSRLGALGMEVFPRERRTPEALGALVKADAEKLGRLSRQPASSRNKSEH